MTHTLRLLCNFSRADDAVYPSSFKRLVSVCLFRAISLWFFSPGTPASFHKVKTDSDRYAGMTSSCPVYGSETHIKPTSFFGSFSTVQWSRGVRMLAVAGLSQALGVEPSQAGSLIQLQQQLFLHTVFLCHFLLLDAGFFQYRPSVKQF